MLAFTKQQRIKQNILSSSHGLYIAISQFDSRTISEVNLIKCITTSEQTEHTDPISAGNKQHVPIMYL